jgi:2-(3-amino-3-carboxypropyl)histidine synthase
MDYLFVDARFSKSFSFLNFNSFFNKLPKKICLVSTIQFVNVLPELKKHLESLDKKVFIKNNGQILGCNSDNALAFEDDADCFLYLGSGKFHPLNLALRLKSHKPIFLLNPLTEEFIELKKDEIENGLKRKKGQQIKFFSASSYGILVSTKPGQNKLKQALELKEKLENKSKKAYLFMFNDLDLNQLENFPKIGCWINSLCPGLSLEQPFVLIDDARNYEKKL